MSDPGAIVAEEAWVPVAQAKTSQDKRSGDKPGDLVFIPAWVCRSHRQAQLWEVLQTPTCVWLVGAGWNRLLTLSSVVSVWLHPPVTGLQAPALGYNLSVSCSV